MTTYDPTGDKPGRADNSDAVRQFTVGRDDEGVRLDRWFKRHLPKVGFAMVSRWARTGQLRVDGKRAEVDTRLAAGQILRVPPGGEAKPGLGGDTPRRELTEAEIELADSMVLTQDRSAIVLNKPPGLATQGGSGGSTRTPRASCSSPARPAARRSSPSASRAAPRARSTGRLSSACPTSTRA
jgi:23S rRNA pseudouridine955/2504/2580 synthase